MLFLILDHGYNETANLEKLFQKPPALLQTILT